MFMYVQSFNTIEAKLGGARDTNNLYFVQRQMATETDTQTDWLKPVHL